MASILITILILVIVFALLWYLISIIPFPPPLAAIRWVFYCILIIVAIVVLLGYIPGFHLAL
jgi:O-antigen/teichoic acid export membrane protein